MSRKNLFISLLCTLFALSSASFASGTWEQGQEKLFNPTGLEMPRFVSLKSNKVFARKGPGK